MFLRYCSVVQMWNCECEILVGHGMISVKGMVDHFFFVSLFRSVMAACNTFYVYCVLMLVVTVEND